MAEVATIARPYAEALFSLADGSGTLPQWSETLTRLAEAAGNADLQHLIGDPKLTGRQLVDLLLAPLGQAGDTTKAFVATLVENKRVAALPAVHEIFEGLKNDREGTLETRIDSAFPLNDAQLASLVADLEKRFKRKIRPEVHVDPELIGGVRVQVGDEVIDGSVRGRLAAMAVALKN
jgi:F-type H+-transporting ATPase subunit delta